MLAAAEAAVAGNFQIATRPTPSNEKGKSARFSNSTASPRLAFTATRERQFSWVSREAERIPIRCARARRKEKNGRTSIDGLRRRRRRRRRRPTQMPSLLPLLAAFTLQHYTHRPSRTRAPAAPRSATSSRTTWRRKRETRRGGVVEGKRKSEREMESFALLFFSFFFSFAAWFSEHSRSRSPSTLEEK